MRPIGLCHDFQGLGDFVQQEPSFAFSKTALCPDNLCEIPSYYLKICIDLINIATGLNTSALDHQLRIYNIKWLSFYFFILSNELSVLGRGSEDELLVDDHLLLVAVEEEVVSAEVGMAASELFQVVGFEEGRLLL